MNGLKLLAMICFASIVANATELLVPTSAAPHGARGSVTIESGGVTLDLQGLKPGEYEVIGRTAVDEILLSVIAIVDPESIPEAVSGTGGKEISVAHQTQVVSCHAQIQLPQGLSSADLKQVRVQDPSGTIVLKQSP